MKKFYVLLCILLSTLLGSTPALASPSLSRGDRNAWVTALQLRLNQAGYSVGTADGDFGGKTASALEKLQTEKGIPVTGVADDATWDALYEEYVSIGSGSAAFDVKLTPPFTTLTKTDDNGGTAIMDFQGVKGTVMLVSAESDSLEGAVDTITQSMNSNFDTMVEQYQATNNVVKPIYFDVAGTQAAMVYNQFDFVNGGTLTRYMWIGCMPVQDGGLMIQASIGFNIDSAAKSAFETLFTDEVIQEIFAGIRVTGQGASETRADSGYEPVGDANISELLPYILKYVDIEAGYGTEITDAARANLYYGAKAMGWFTRMVAAGNDRDAVLKEAKLEIIVSAMDSELRKTYSDLSQKYISMLSSLLSFPEEDTRAALAEMGISEIGWTEQDVADMMEWGVNAFVQSM